MTVIGFYWLVVPRGLLVGKKAKNSFTQLSYGIFVFPVTSCDLSTGHCAYVAAVTLRFCPMSHLKPRGLGRPPTSAFAALHTQPGIWTCDFCLETFSSEDHDLQFYTHYHQRGKCCQGESYQISHYAHACACLHASNVMATTLIWLRQGEFIFIRS